MQYAVYRTQTITTIYNIKATSIDEAIELAQSGEAEEVDYTNETEYEAVELG